MNYIYILNHKELFPSVIGITHKQFESVLPKFSSALRRREHRKAYEKKRQRDVGGGRKAKLATDRQKLFFIFFYYKVYPTFRFAQAIFELDKSNIQVWKEFLEPVLFEALGYELELPKLRVNGMTGLLEVCPALREFVADATERPIRRPKNPKNQTRYYSGRKKHHTVKNQIVVAPKTKRILSVSATVEGKLHDKKLMEQDKIIYYAPPKAKGLGDLGYQGIKEVNPLICFITPLKKPPGKELSPADQETNKNLASIRIRVEHPLSYLKHFAILANPFRNRLSKAHLPFVNLACVYNFTRTHR